MALGIGILGFAHGHVGSYLAQWRAHPEYGVAVVAGWDHDAARLEKNAAPAGLRQHATAAALAQVAALAALDDRDYEEETRQVITEEKARLEEGFSRLGVTWFPSAANYYLLSFPKAQTVREWLRRKGILTRDCSSFIGLDETFLRVAVKSRHDNLILLKEMAACVAW